MDSESRMTLKVIKGQEEDLINTLRKASHKRNYLNETSSDRLSGSYNEIFDDLTNIQEKCRTAYTNINSATQTLKKFKNFILEINKVLTESKKILNNKKVATLKGIVRTYILDNPDYFKIDNIEYKPEDLEREEDTEEVKEAKRIRRENDYPIRDVLHQIGEEDPGYTDAYIEEGQEGQEGQEYDPTEDPLYGTHGFPQHLMNGPPTFQDGGIMTKTQSIKKNNTKKNKKRNKTKKRKANKNKNTHRKR